MTMAVMQMQPTNFGDMLGYLNILAWCYCAL